VESDAQLAITVAKQAGQLLLKLREDFGPVDPDDKVRRTELKDKADAASHELIMALLGEARPDDAILSEEGVDEVARDSADRVWIVDPLDGTREYGLGRSDFAVHIALWDRHVGESGGLITGVVDLPAQHRTLSTIDEVSAPRTVDDSRAVQLIVSRSRPPEIAKDVGREALASALQAEGQTSHGVEIIHSGSVGVKVAEVLADRADAYVHDTGFYEWDVAAPLALAQHYGLTAAHIDGSEITFNHRPPWVTSLIVALPTLAPFMIDKSLP
jgi:3'(2'), 5'-bisphosphate nucleotidase